LLCESSCQKAAEKAVFFISKRVAALSASPTATNINAKSGESEANATLVDNAEPTVAESD